MAGCRLFELVPLPRLDRTWVYSRKAPDGKRIQSPLYTHYSRSRDAE